MRKLLPLVIVLVALAALACGDSTDKDAEPTAEPTAVPVATAPATTVPQAAAAPAGDVATAAPAPEPAPTTAALQPPVVPIEQVPSGGSFRRLWSDPPTLDPHLVTDTTSAFVVVEVYSGLVTLNTNLELVPDIAERWERTDDGLQYTFYLRPEAKFHDGKPVTAQDFKWSIERAADPDTASPVAETYLADIVGVQDVLDGNATEVSGIQVIDSRTLQITIDAPKAYFLAKLTYPTAYVLDRENVESGGRLWSDHPNGTGPFKLKEYSVGERIVLERNEHFYRGSPAHLDTVVMNLAGGQSMAMYENDEIDITGVGLFDLERILEPSDDLHSELVVAPPDFSVSYVGFNTDVPPFDDPKFRQALNHAVDKELIAREVFSDLVVAAYGVLPPGFPGYNADLEGLRYNPDLAVKLLNESKYADPDTRPRIVITVPGTGGTIGLDLEVVIEMWLQKLGVDVEIQQLEWATYLQELNEGKPQAFAGLGWEADYPDPQDFLDILFHTDSQINHGNYSNPGVDRILEQARVEQDILKRIELYNEVEKLIIADAAWVPLWYTGERHVLIKPHVKGYTVTPMIVPRLREVHLE